MYVPNSYLGKLLSQELGLVIIITNFCKVKDIISVSLLQGSTVPSECFLAGHPAFSIPSFLKLTPLWYGPDPTLAITHRQRNHPKLKTSAISHCAVHPWSVWIRKAKRSALLLPISTAWCFHSDPAHFYRAIKHVWYLEMTPTWGSINNHEFPPFNSRLCTNSRHLFTSTKEAR